ncbi:uncharacterized protein TNCV_5126971 [Trichonephila clavipes]|nr:uncharacterized protein TNCV_5126971 [Trichonephila clavipes]
MRGNTITGGCLLEVVKTGFQLCFQKIYDAGRSVSLPNGATLNVGVLRCCELFRLTDHVILNHGQTWTTPKLAPPLLTTTPHQREDVSTLDRFNVHRCPTRLDFSGTGLEPVTKQATVRYLYHSATAATVPYNARCDGYDRERH